MLHTWVKRGFTFPTQKGNYMKRKKLFEWYSKRLDTFRTGRRKPRWSNSNNGNRPFCLDAACMIVEGLSKCGCLSGEVWNVSTKTFYLCYADWIKPEIFLNDSNSFRGVIFKLKAELDTYSMWRVTCWLKSTS